MSALAHLRAAMQAAGVDGFIVPVADEYLGEYVPDSAKRITWLTGFSGSAGLVAVLKDKAALFVDGRYTLQAKGEVDTSLYAVYNSADVKPEAWLKEQLKDAALGYDPWLHSVKELRKYKHAGLQIKPLSPNPIDALWEHRPAAPQGKAFAHALRYAGASFEEKVARVAEEIRKKGADALILSACDSVNWLLNIRGTDLHYSPLVLAYAIVHADGAVTLYIDRAKVSEAIPKAVNVRAPAQLEADMQALAQKKVMFDPAITPAWFAQVLKHPIEAEDPCQLAKAVKNAVELQGIRSAHIRDGVAVSRFLCWLDAEAQKNSVSEMNVSDKILAFRREAAEFVAPSFETIAGSGPNGAIVHYRVDERSNRMLQQGELLLLDSGAQYPDGTTDITRTIAIGAAGAAEKTNFTRVLKGHISLARALFPEGTGGTQLDILARQALWQEGLDYDHGTGHGVGCFLSVHEGPQRIGKRGGDVALKAGMIVSNEPGYYKEGAYGIRIESLVAVVEKGKMENGKAQLGFETLTCVPIDTRLVDKGLLTAEEIAWLNQYHAWVQKTLSPMLNAQEKQWLEAACRPI